MGRRGEGEEKEKKKKKKDKEKGSDSADEDKGGGLPLLLAAGPPARVIHSTAQPAAPAAPPVLLLPHPKAWPDVGACQRRPGRRRRRRKRFEALRPAHPPTER